MRQLAVVEEVVGNDVVNNYRGYNREASASCHACYPIQTQIFIDLRVLCVDRL